jgi:aminoglycoside/choline kinase family phosphotransferase
MEDRSDPRGFAAFLRLSKHLNALGLSAPEVYESDDTLCLALLEDFGEDTYGRLLASGAAERALYLLAVDALKHLHAHPAATQVDAPVFDRARLLEEVSVFSDWLVPAQRPGLDVAAFDHAFQALWAEALAGIEDAPRTLVLRDFHIDNLIVLKDRAGVARCGLLDFQDGLIGAPEYDLVSLLQDARRDLADGLEAEMLAHYFADRPDAEIARRRYAVLGAQRHTRIAGVFIRLHQRDGKPGYLRFLPRVIRQMQTAFSDAGLSDIADFLDQELPGWRDAGGSFASDASS